MKNYLIGGLSLTGKIIWGVILGILGAMISVVPNFILRTCEHCMDMGMKCPTAAKAEFIIGVMILLMAVFFIASESNQARWGISVGMVMLGILTALMATIIIGFCDGSCSTECTCSSLRAPAMIAMGTLVSLISLVNSFFLSCSKR
jgi:drug/metabolite transporter (DMT)-like permease